MVVFFEYVVGLNLKYLIKDLFAIRLIHFELFIRDKHVFFVTNSLCCDCFNDSLHYLLYSHDNLYYDIFFVKEQTWSVLGELEPVLFYIILQCIHLRVSNSTLVANIFDFEIIFLFGRCVFDICVCLFSFVFYNKFQIVTCLKINALLYVYKYWDWNLI